MKNLMFVCFLLSMCLSAKTQGIQLNSNVSFYRTNCITFHSGNTIFSSPDGIIVFNNLDNKIITQYPTYTYSETYNPKTYSNEINKRKNPVIDAVIGPNNIIWFAVSDGSLLCYDNDSFKLIKQTRSFFDVKFPVYYFNKGKWEKSNKNYLTGYYSCVAIDNKNIIFLGTNNGIEKFDGNNWSMIKESDGLISNNVNTIFIDLNNNIWVGTDKGISKYNGQSWENITTSNGLISNKVSIIKTDNRGGIWIGTDKGLSVFDGSIFKSFNKKNGLLDNEVSSLAVDKSNKIWIGTKKGISCFDNGNWNNIVNINGLKANEISMIEISPEGLIYVYAIGWWNEYLLKFNGSDWKTEYSLSPN